MSIILTISYFLLASNSILLLLLKFNLLKNKGNTLLLLFSYGVGPFLYTLIFYASIWLFPSKNSIFYTLIISVFCLIIVLLGIKNVKECVELNKEWVIRLIMEAKRLPKLIVLTTLVFISLYIVQLFAFPIVDNDSVYYLNQAEATYIYKNLDWQKKPEVKINNGDSYTFKPSIRPGITSLIASNYLFIGDNRHNFFTFRFLVFYYYLLLFILFLHCIKEISKKLLIKPSSSLSMGMLLYIFFWSLTRSLIFSAKEPIIYFFTLLSILFIAMMQQGKNNNIYNKIFLGIILGINVLVNLHGLIIECIILILYFLFVKQSFYLRALSTSFILLVSIPVGGFELIMNFVPVFVKSLGIYKKPTIQTPTQTTESYKRLYQTTSVLSEYIKGRFQMLTNIGIFGFNFWLFLVVLGKYFKRVARETISRLILVFILIYFIVVLDPFSINKNPFVIVLWGSSKYSTLLVLLSLIITSVFLGDLIKWFTNFLRKNNIIFLISASILMPLLIININKIIDLGTNLLLLTIPVYKERIFYQSAVEKFFILIIFILACMFLVLFLVRTYKNDRPLLYFSKIIVIFVILTPSLISVVGKVPLHHSLSFIGKSQREVLESIYYEGDIFRAFHKAQDTLPKGTILKTDFYELSLYNNGYFLLVPSYSDNYSYSIVNGCAEEENTIYTFNQVSLCKISTKNE